MQYFMVEKCWVIKEQRKGSRSWPEKLWSFVAFVVVFVVVVVVVMF